MRKLSTQVDNYAMQTDLFGLDGFLNKTPRQKTSSILSYQKIKPSHKKQAILLELKTLKYWLYAFFRTRIILV